MSFLKTLSIAGYRGFNEPRLIHLAVPKDQGEGSGLTIITGANNSGKSTAIEALRARSGHQAPSFSEGVRNKHADFVRIIYEFEEGSAGVDGQSAVVEARIEVVESQTAGSSQSVHMRSGVHNTDRVDEPDPIRVVPSRRGFQPYFGRQLGTLQDFQRQGGLPARRMAELSSFEMRLFDIEKDPSKFNTLLGELLGYTPKWTIDQTSEGNYYIRLGNGVVSHSSDGAGEGIVSLFSIVDALTSTPPGGIVAIDEPELSLHPAIIRRLVRAIVRLSAEKQVIVATHSPYFIDPEAIARGAALVRVTSEIGGSNVYQLSDQGRAALKKIHDPENPNTKAPHTFGLDARELFFQDDGIVLTEGQDDVMLYPSVARQLPIGRVPGHMFGWGVGGAGNMQHLCRLLQDMGYRKVAGLLDNDQTATLPKLERDFPDYLFFTIPAKDVRDKNAEGARPAVIGLLENAKILREEYREPMQSIFESILAAFGGDATQAPASPVGGNA
ncbi:ATP-dependent nuclease [Stenotrophomonas nitritireducens]|uniref:ATP-dependent nuclease n=1 Tax=Stenotrophomonas nitritireducens TaxID=83617 RepID=UPI0009E676D7|nr:ATP-binding protein [Stenotrophomonas nitritireducens]